MALVRGAVSVTIDNPDADGIIALYGQGYGYTWRFRSKDDVGDRNLPLEPEWDYATGGAEYLPALKGCAPRGIAYRYDMNLGAWPQTHGVWREVVCASHPQKKFLWYANANPDEYGHITSSIEIGPNVAIWMFRSCPPDDQTQAAFTTVALFPAASGDSWMYYLPLNAQEEGWKFPRLLRVPRGTSLPVTDPDAYTVDEYQSGPLAKGTAHDAVFTIQNTDGHLIACWSDTPEDWVYRPSGGIYLGGCDLAIQAQGHSLAFNAQPIRYPATAYARVRSKLTTPVWAAASHSYYPLYYAPSGCTVATNSADTDDSPSPLNPDRPWVKFTTNGQERPVAYAVKQWHTPEFTTARSSALNLDGPGVVLEARGSCNDSWRGSTCDLTLRVDPDQYLFKGNNKVTVDVGWTEAATPTSAPPPARQFTGYITSLSREKRADELGKVYLNLHCEDTIAARLQGKKYIRQQSAFAFQPLVSTFQYLLLCAGVPTTLIDTSLINPQDYVLPIADRQGDLLFDFGSDTEIVSALDTIAEACGHYWGVTVAGTCFMARRPEYSGTPNFTLDASTVTETDLVYELSSERGDADFRNYMYVVAGQGAQAQAGWASDYDTHYGTGTPDYIGEDWWEVVVDPDSSAEQAGFRAMLLLRERLKHRQIVKWETAGKNDLWPNHYVLVDAATSGIDVEAGTILRILQKDWSVVMGTGEYRCSFLAAKEQ